MKKRLTLFAHWDKDNVIDDYVIHYLSELKKVSDIVFVSDCDLTENELIKIDHLTLISKAERHGEYDFGSYKRAYILAENLMNNYQELLFINDSCYGPFFSLETLLNESMNADFWGIYKHKTPHYGDIEHIQSFFMVFKEKVFKTECFKMFLLNVKKEKTKREVIEKYEIGLSKFLHENQFKSSSIIPISDETLAYKQESFTFINQEKVPIIKRELLLTNPLWVPNIYNQFLNLPDENSLKRKIIFNLNRLSNGQYVNRWFLNNVTTKYILFHKKFILFKRVSFKYGIMYKIKLFGISFIKIPIIFFRKHSIILKKFSSIN